MADAKERSLITSPNIASYKPLNIILQIIGLILILAVFFWVVLFRGGFGFSTPKIVFNWHPLLMTIAFVYLFANAILHYRTFRDSKKQDLKNQHSIIHGCILIIVLLAAFAALASHLFAKPPIPNFYSLHSWLGVVTVVLFLSQFACGLWFFLSTRTADNYREAMLPYHVFFGIFIFVLSVVTCILGISEKLIFALYLIILFNYTNGNYLRFLYIYMCINNELIQLFTCYLQGQKL